MVSHAHVTSVDLERPIARLEVRRRQDCVNASKQSDFNDNAFVHGRPRKVTWLRVPNAATEAIETITTQRGTPDPPSIENACSELDRADWSSRCLRSMTY